MIVKIKPLDWNAGLPVAMLNHKTAKELGVQLNDRIKIKSVSKKIEFFTIVDTISRVVSYGEIAITNELRKRMGLKKNQKVEISLASISKSTPLIIKKLNKKSLSQKEFNIIIKEVVNNTLSDSEIALFISGMYNSGMSFNETTYLINAILKTGKKLKKNSNGVDKHCIGGVAGNRTTIVIVPILAAAGLIIPKASSRAITSAAGTADVVETITNVEFSIRQLKKIVKKTNACLIWGGALGIVPADSKIIKIEKKLKIDPEAQLLASIMSKKLAMGSYHILIDIPYGNSAKVNKSRALRLKKKFQKLGRHYKKNLRVVLTDGSQPIGNGVGPVLELNDVINILNPNKIGPRDLQEKSVFLAGELFEMAGVAKKGKGKVVAEEIITSGKAYEKFVEIVKTQGGKIRKFKLAKYQKNILSKKQGKIISINNKKINNLARVAGSPLHIAAGVFLHNHVGDKVKKKSKLLTIYAESKPRLNQAIKLYEKSCPIIVK